MTMPPLSPSDATDTDINPSESSWTIQSTTEIAYVRRQCMAHASAGGGSYRAGVELSIAVTELLTNALKFGNRAEVTLQGVQSPAQGIQIVILDNGPGFDNMELAPVDGYSEGRFLIEDDCISHRRGLGMGLGAVSRLTDRMLLENAEEGGARVTIWKWLR
jgi:serine/threonine-protein kinase RsbT